VTSDWLGRGLTPREKAALAVEILGAYSRARWLLWRTDLPSTLAALRAVDARSPSDPAEADRTGVRLGEAVGKTLRHLPFDSRCLMRSLVLTSLLARRGVAASFIIAVKPESEFIAHAWVERAGVPLLEPAGPAFARIVEL
jgi:hypothetical protein